MELQTKEERESPRRSYNEEEETVNMNIIFLLEKDSKY